MAPAALDLCLPGGGKCATLLDEVQQPLQGPEKISCWTSFVAVLKAEQFIDKYDALFRGAGYYLESFVVTMSGFTRHPRLLFAAMLYGSLAGLGFFGTLVLFLWTNLATWIV